MTEQPLDVVPAAADEQPTWTVEAIVEALDTAGRKLPEAAIQAARQQRAEIIPKLIEVLQQATAAAREGPAPPRQAVFFALFLLAEFRAKEALPAIVDAFSLPAGLPGELFGDAVHQLPRLVIPLADDPLGLFESWLENRTLDLNVRWNAATGLRHLVRDGRLTRDEAVARLRRHLRAAIDHEDCELTGALITELSALCPVEAMAEIREAFERQLVDEFLVQFEDIERCLAEGPAGVQREQQRLGPPTLDDTLAELRHWAAFAEPPKPPPAAPAAPRPAWPARPRPPQDRERSESSGTLRAVLPRVGRNDPCPCGSGKKFKKCCG